MEDTRFQRTVARAELPGEAIDSASETAETAIVQGSLYLIGSLPSKRTEDSIWRKGIHFFNTNNVRMFASGSEFGNNIL